MEGGWEVGGCGACVRGGNSHEHSQQKEIATLECTSRRTSGSKSTWGTYPSPNHHRMSRRNSPYLTDIPRMKPLSQRQGAQVGPGNCFASAMGTAC